MRGVCVLLLFYIIHLSSEAQFVIPRLYMDGARLDGEFASSETYSSYYISRKGVKSLSYRYMGYSLDSVTNYNGEELENPKPLNYTKVFKYNPEGYLIECHENSSFKKIFLEKEDSICIEHEIDGVTANMLTHYEDFCATSIQDMDLYYGGDKYSITELADTIIINTNSFIGKYAYTKKDTLLRRVFYNNENNSLYMNICYDDFSRRTRTDVFTLLKSKSKLRKSIINYFDDNNLIIKKEIIIHDSDNIGKKSICHFFYNEEMDLDYIMVKDSRYNKCHIYNYEYEYYSQKDGKKHEAPYCNKVRLFEQPTVYNSMR